MRREKNWIYKDRDRENEKERGEERERQIERLTDGEAGERESKRERVRMGDWV